MHFLFYWQQEFWLWQCHSRPLFKDHWPNLHDILHCMDQISAHHAQDGPWHTKIITSHAACRTMRHVHNRYSSPGKQTIQHKTGQVESSPNEYQTHKFSNTQHRMMQLHLGQVAVTPRAWRKQLINAGQQTPWPSISQVPFTPCVALPVQKRQLSRIWEGTMSVAFGLLWHSCCCPAIAPLAQENEKQWALNEKQLITSMLLLSFKSKLQTVFFVDIWWTTRIFQTDTNTTPKRLLGKCSLCENHLSKDHLVALKPGIDKYCNNVAMSDAKLTTWLKDCHIAKWWSKNRPWTTIVVNCMSDLDSKENRSPYAH